MVQVFLTHTRKDEEFCNRFDNVCADVGMKRFRSEFAKVGKPEWKKIKEEMNKSVAVFFLVGNELVKSQNSGDPDWRYTQNWIAYEIGLACQMGIDVWAVCDDVLINFPIPYINNYLTVSLKHELAFDYAKAVLEAYNNGMTFPYPYRSLQTKIVNNIPESTLLSLGTTCHKCKIEFNLHVTLKPGRIIRCPQCLGDLIFPTGFPITLTKYATL